MTAWDRETAEVRLAELAPLVAKALGAGWAREKRDNVELSHYMGLVHGDERVGLYVSYPYGRLSISGNLNHVRDSRGLLTVYFGASEPASPEIETATDAALDDARAESRRTCEICGAPGVRKERDHYISVLCVPCEWLDEIAEACRRLAGCVEGMDLPAFAAHEIRPDAARRHLQHLGEAARHQSPKRRARLPGVNWERLNSLRAVTGALAMSPKEIWSFVHDDVVALVEALR